MVSEVIDLVSSSPPPNSRPVNNAFTRETRPMNPPMRTSIGNDAVKSNEIDFFSDDFDTTIDLDEPIIATATVNKKRRLSPPENTSRPAKRSLSGSIAESSVPAARNGGRRASTIEPIEFSSSPEVSIIEPTSLSPRNRTVSRPATRKPTTVEVLDDDIDPFAISSQPETRPVEKSLEARRTTTIETLDGDDPFAISSQPETQPVEKPIGTRKITTIETLDDDLDPFAISSQPETQPVERPPPSAQNAPESSDPFASSPLSIIETSKPSIRAKPPASPTANRRTSPKRKKWDPISSSAPEACSFDSPSPRSSRGAVINIGDSDSEDGSEEDFPDIADFDIAKCKVRSLRRTLSETAAKSRSKTSKSQSTSKSQPRASKPPPKSIEDKEREKEAKAASREADKEKKRREREEAKQAKLREKERNAALAEVNKLRTDKKVSTPEMMVDIPSSLNITTRTQLEAMLEPLDVQFATWESPVENVVKWRRKVRSRFNEEIGIWEPIPLRITEEKHALVVMTAAEFVTLAIEETLEAHVTKMEEHFANHHIIYLLEGLIPWMRKNRNIRNRQFTSGVRAETQSNRRRNTATEGYVPEETIEDALLQLQIMHDVLIHHTITPLETVNWITVFTQHVSTIPYRKQRDQATLVAGFCMESGQVKTGEDAKDTYIRMLQEIVRVTAPIAYGIATKYETVTDLVNGLEREGPTVLEGVQKCANRDGAFSDRTVGQAVSRRMHKVFTGKDELSTDV